MWLVSETRQHNSDIIKPKSNTIAFDSDAYCLCHTSAGYRGLSFIRLYFCSVTQIGLATECLTIFRRVYTNPINLRRLTVERIFEQPRLNGRNQWKENIRLKLQHMPRRLNCMTFIRSTCRGETFSWSYNIWMNLMTANIICLYVLQKHIFSFQYLILMAVLNVQYCRTICSQ